MNRSRKIRRILYEASADDKSTNLIIDISLRNKNDRSMVILAEDSDDLIIQSIGTKNKKCSDDSNDDDHNEIDANSNAIITRTETNHYLFKILYIQYD